MDKVERNVYACSYTLPFRGNGALLRAMHKAKSLYNAALWYYRQALDEHHLAEKEGRDPLVEYPDYYKMERKFRDERQINYFDLPQKVSQQVLRDVQSDWRSYVAHVVRNKAYPEGSPERKERINPPHYKKKEGYARLRYTIQAISFKRYPGKACPSGIDVGLDIPSFVNPYRIQQLVIEPDGADYIRVTFIYKVDLADMLTDNGRIMGIDLGVNNLATCGTNVGPGIIINGRPLKSINQYFNKKLAKMKSDNDALLDKELKRKVETQRHRMTRNIERLFRKRKYKIKDYLHKASCRIFEYAAANGITTIVVGKNAGWKQECGMGTQNNQNFVQIPPCPVHRHPGLQGACTWHRIHHGRGVVHVEVLVHRRRGHVPSRQVPWKTYQAWTVPFKGRHTHKCRPQHNQKSSPQCLCGGDRGGCSSANTYSRCVTNHFMLLHRNPKL